MGCVTLTPSGLFRLFTVGSGLVSMRQRTQREEEEVPPTFGPATRLTRTLGLVPGAAIGSSTPPGRARVIR